MQRALAGLLRAVRAVRVVALYDDRRDVRRVERRRDPVVEEVRRAQEAAVVDGVRLHLRLGRAHVDAALDLPLDERRVQRLAAVVRGPQLHDLPHAGLGVDAHLGDVRREAVRRRRADGAAAVVGTELLRAVAAGRGERAELRLGFLHSHCKLFGGVARLVELRAELATRLDGREADHVRHARAVRAEVDRCEVGVGGDDRDVVGVAAELFGGDLREERVDALADVARARVDGDAPRAVELHEDARLRHLVGVHRIRGAADVHRARDAEAAAEAELAAPLLPAARALDRVEAHREAVRGDALPVDGRRVLADEVLAAHLDGVDAEARSRHVEGALEGEPRLNAPVPALRPARRLVRVHARRVEAVRPEAIRTREELARVVRGDEAERRVGAAVDDDLRLDSLDGAVLREPHAKAHLHRVAPAVRVEDLLARVEHLHRAAGLHRELRRAQLERERVALPAERAAQVRLDDAHPRLREAEHLRQRAVDVVRDLRRRPEREPGAVPRRDRAVGLDRRVRRALVEERLVGDDCTAAESFVHRAERERHRLRDVVLVARSSLVVDEDVGARERLVGVEQGRQRVVRHAHEAHGLLGGALARGRDDGHRIADEPHLVDGQRLLVLRPRDDAVALRQLGPDERRDHARHLQRLGEVDAEEPRVRDARAHGLRVQHARQREVVGVDGGAGGLEPPFELALALADAHPPPPRERSVGSRTLRTGAVSAGCRCPAATCTAS